MKAIIYCKHQDEIDLWLKDGGGPTFEKWQHCFENWADVKWLNEFQSTQRELEDYIDSVEEDIIIFVSGLAFKTVPKHSLAGIDNAIGYGYNRSKFCDAVHLVAEVLECE